MSGRFIASDLKEKIYTYREQRFTGLVKVTSAKGYQWFIYYLLGSIVWTKSRTHSLRRWQRHLAFHSPGFFEKVAQPIELHYELCNYATLARLVKLKQFRRDQFSRIVGSCISEVFFDILQVGTLEYGQSGSTFTYEAYAKEAASLPFIMLQQERAWQEAKQEWLSWEKAGFAKFSPDWAPVITQMDTLRTRTSAQTFQTLTTFVDGSNTLRDLAIKLKQPLIPLMQSILPYVSRKMLGLCEIPDLVENAHDDFNLNPLKNYESPGESLSQPAGGYHRLDRRTATSPAAATLPQASSSSVTPASESIAISPQPPTGQYSNDHSGLKGDNRAPQIVYIDDSSADSRLMSAIVEELGCRYTNISDPLQALPLLIEYKPELIFLDLVMPIANGYEVCAQIRRISSLKEIPVIIVTSNDSIADRVKAKIVGASGFLGKPIRQKKVSKVLEKHLRQIVSTKHLRYVKTRSG